MWGRGTGNNRLSSLNTTSRLTSRRRCSSAATAIWPLSDGANRLVEIQLPSSQASSSLLLPWLVPSRSLPLLSPDPSYLTLHNGHGKILVHACLLHHQFLPSFLTHMIVSTQGIVLACESQLAMRACKSDWERHKSRFLSLPEMVAFSCLLYSTNWNGNLPHCRQI